MEEHDILALRARDADYAESCRRALVMGPRSNMDLANFPYGGEAGFKVYFVKNPNLAFYFQPFIDVYLSRY